MTISTADGYSQRFNESQNLEHAVEETGRYIDERPELLDWHFVTAFTEMIRHLPKHVKISYNNNKAGKLIFSQL